MPNTAVWGNPDDDQKEEQDLVTPENPEEGDPAIIRVNDVNNNDADRAAIYAANSNAGANARALKVEGKSSLNGTTFITDDSEDAVLDVQNSGNGPSISADGQIEVGLDGIACEGPLKLGSLQTDGIIEGVPTPQPGPICIGTGENSGTIYLGRVGQTVKVDSALQVGADDDDPGLIDAKLDGEDARDLDIGSGNSTADLNLSRAGQDVNVADDLNVSGDCAVTGDLTVGPADATGDIDSGGSAGTPQKLRIGNGDGTDNILLSRSGKTVAFKGQAQMNSNGIVMNNASSVASGTGFIFNSEGHNGGGASIDVYTGGVLRGWIDSNGFVNA